MPIIFAELTHAIIRWVALARGLVLHIDSIRWVALVRGLLPRRELLLSSIVCVKVYFKKYVKWLNVFARWLPEKLAKHRSNVC